MSSHSSAPEEDLAVLKYLRDHDFIQGIDCIPPERMREAIDWNEARMDRVLKSCRDSHCVGLLPSSSVYITPVGLKALLQAGW